MRKSILIKFFVFLAITTLFINSGISYAAQIPTDIKKHWAEKEITSAASEGWAYIEKGQFSPNKSATREEVAWMLVGACKTVSVPGFNINTRADMSKFRDKASSWANDRMSITIGNNLIGGYPDNSIQPRASITRAEFAVILGRLQNITPSHFLPFWDTIPGWAVEGVEKSYASNIITGYSDGSFKPNAKVTKAEALVMIKRWQDETKKGKPVSSEFSKIIAELPDIKLDGSKLTYYTDGKPAYSTDPGNFYVADNNNNAFELSIFRYKNQPTLDVVKKVLEVFYPSEFQKAYSELIATTDSKVWKMNTFDNRTFRMQWFSNHVEINIGKLK